MFTEQKLEQHYSSLPSETLHIIRDEYKWALETCGVHSGEVKAWQSESTTRYYSCANVVRAVS